MMSLLKKLRQQVCIDDHVFRLHYRATAFFLAISSVVVTSKQYIGDPIDCILDSSIDQKAVNTYCWIFSTFTITHRKQENQVPSSLAEPYPGVGNEHDASEIVHQKYYQWVCFILAIQAAFFVLPHSLWQAWEGGRIKMLVSDLCSPMAELWTEERKQQTVDYLARSNLHHLNLYAIQFLFCEFLNVLNIFLQILVWNKVLGNRFLTFGPDVIQFATSGDLAARDPVTDLFPKMTKCTFHYFGPSGSLQRIDAICVLPLNIVNEKIFIFLWFWFFTLAFTTIAAFLYDVFLFRKQRLREYVLQAQARLVPRAHIRTIVSKGTLGLWLLLHQLGRNMNPFVFGDLLAALARALDKSKLRLRERQDFSTPV